MLGDVSEEAAVLGRGILISVVDDVVVEETWDEVDVGACVDLAEDESEEA